MANQAAVFSLAAVFSTRLSRSDVAGGDGIVQKRGVPDLVDMDRVLGLPFL